MAELVPGLSGEASYESGPEQSSLRFGAAVDVYSTPSMVGLMEAAAIDAVAAALPEGSTTVGTGMTFQHTAATPIGAAIRARAELVQVDGRKLVFRVEAFDPWEQIGSADHERFVVDLSRFTARVVEKAAKPSGG